MQSQPSLPLLTSTNPMVICRGNRAKRTFYQKFKFCFLGLPKCSPDKETRKLYLANTVFGLALEGVSHLLLIHSNKNVGGLLIARNLSLLLMYPELCTQMGLTYQTHYLLPIVLIRESDQL